MEKLLELLSELRPDLDFSAENRLIDDGVFDSFDIITAVTEMNEEFDVRINVADLTPENMNSATAMWELITRLREKRSGV